MAKTEVIVPIISTNPRTGLMARTWTVPVALLGVSLISFGLFSPWLGFYWDDWPTIWFLHFLGPAGFKDVFAVDRPLLGWLFRLTTPLLGESTLGWQLFGLITRWICCLTLWWMIRTVWPQRTQQATWIAFLFAIYPGFRQQYIAVTYSHAWVILAALFISLGSLVWAVRRPRWFWPLMVLSWSTSTLIMFTDEYFFGLELLRPVLLWLALSESIKDLRKRAGRVLTIWLPYLATMVVFFVWRVFIQYTPRGQVQIFDQLQANPFKAMVDLTRTIFTDMAEVSVIAWAKTAIPSGRPEISEKLFPYYLAIVAGTAVFTLLYLAFLGRIASIDSAADKQSSRRWAVQAIGIGVLALFLGGWPFWVTSLPVELRFPWDRFTLSMMLGACILLAGAVELLRNQLAKVVILGIVVGLAAGIHFNDGFAYRREWNAQKNSFWQLTWRAPAIRSGTTVLTAGLPFIYFSDNSLTGPLNWIYSGKAPAGQMPYLVYDLESRLGKELSGLAKDIPIEMPYRALSFSGSTSQALVLYFPRDGCLRILDPVRDKHVPVKEGLVDDSRHLSDPENILTGAGAAAQPPLNIFGPEPEHTWCYYFQKAELARQMEDWQQIVRLGKEAFRQDMAPTYKNEMEYLPFVEGYARASDWEQAYRLTKRAIGPIPMLPAALCYTWQRIQQSTAPSPERENVLTRIMQEIPRCPLD